MGIKWKDDYSVETQRFFGLLVGAASGFIAALCFASIIWDWGILYEARLWEVLTSVGTIGASCVALGIAVWQFRAKRAEQLAVAYQAAAYSYLSLSVYADEIEVCREILDKTMNSEGVDGNALVHTLNHFQGIGDEYSFPDPSVFIPISAKIAAQLAAALGRMSVLKRQFRIAANKYLNGGWRDLEERKELSDFFCDELGGAAALLKAVSAACRDAAVHLDE